MKKLLLIPALVLAACFATPSNASAGVFVAIPVPVPFFWGPGPVVYGPGPVWVRPGWYWWNGHYYHGYYRGGRWYH